MTRILPQGTDTLNNPSHSLLHRVVSVDTGSPESSIDIDNIGNVTIAASIITPLLVGGGADGSKITYKSTTGIGTPTGVAHQFIGGTNGGTVAMTVLNNGNVGIGTTTPTASLHIKAGTATAGTAPLKFTSGTLNTTPEAGAIEFLTDRYYATITTGAERKTFAFLESPIFTGTTTIQGLTIGLGNNAIAGNTAVGVSALSGNNSGDGNNSAFGKDSLKTNTSGYYNTAIGNGSLYSNTTGAFNSALGNGSLSINTTGQFNSAFGLNSLFSNSTGSNNIGIGYNAGRYETGSGAFYVDSRDRTNTAGDKSGAILYGVMSNTPSSQTLKTNSAFEATYGMNIPTGQTYKINNVSIVEDSITDGHTTVAPSGNAVFDALALKLSLAGGTMTGKFTSAGKDEVGKTYTPSSGSQTVTIDCSLNNMHIVSGNANGTAITFAITGATNSQCFIISILQGGTTVSTIAGWFATIRWAGGTAPTLTATLNKRDTFGFIRTGANTYDGFVIGQNC